MIQTRFANQVKSALEKDENVMGLAVGGSWLTKEMDEFSDLDLIVVTENKITDDKHEMLHFAKRFDHLLSAFTGEHVGEPRLLICLYDKPLLHVDFKFVTIEEFKTRIETPVVLLDKTGELETALANSKAAFPHPDFQWIEDRFWIWVHYALLKIGRGEYLEAFDFLGFLRTVVLGPLLHLKNKNLPRGVRRVETELNRADLAALIATIPIYERQSLLEHLRNAIELYRDLRKKLFDDAIRLQRNAEEKVMEYFEKIETD